MNCLEAQQEELEVLRSIYDGDDRYTEMNPSTIQYKIGENDGYKSFLLEIKWDEDYPEKAPNINLDAFYNKHLNTEVKHAVIKFAEEQAENLLETAMTYTLIESVKENSEDLLANQPNSPPVQAKEEEDSQAETAKKKEKKETLTKAQKRRMYDKFGASHVNADDKPRGWDWVDLVKHLSQVGTKEQQSAPPKG